MKKLQQRAQAIKSTLSSSFEIGSSTTILEAKNWNFTIQQENDPKMIEI